MEAEVMAWATQFGVAGLIGWMWLAERRASAERERQIGEAHRRILGDREDRAAVLEALRDATRAMAAIEAGQRSLAALVERSIRSHADREDAA